MTVAFLILAGVAAVGDSLAVGRRMRRLEYALKPLVLLLLIGAACFADLGASKPWVLAALLLGLAGDVALLLRPEERAPVHGSAELPFLIGLGAFLLGHLAYLVAFVRHGLHVIPLFAGVLVVLGTAVLALPRVLPGADRQGGRRMAALVGAYAAVLGAMTVLGFGTAALATGIGALLLLASDVTLAWGRYVQPLLRGPVIVAVTYHLAQLLIVVGLIA